MPSVRVGMVLHSGRLRASLFDQSHRRRTSSSLFACWSPHANIPSCNAVPEHNSTPSSIRSGPAHSNHPARSGDGRLKLSYPVLAQASRLYDPALRR